MNLEKIVSELVLEPLTPTVRTQREVTGAYVSDLLSDVMGNAQEGSVLITLQTHLNIVAVASLKGLSAIILVNNRTPADDTIRKAAKEGIPLFRSPLPAYELSGRLYSLGLRCR